MKKLKILINGTQVPIDKFMALTHFSRVTLEAIAKSDSLSLGSKTGEKIEVLFEEGGKQC